MGLVRLGCGRAAVICAAVLRGGQGRSAMSLYFEELGPAVKSLIVVDALAEVIEWHAQGLLPLGKQITGDPRCRLVHCAKLKSATRGCIMPSGHDSH
jgi:hypothetical protein